MKILKLLGTLFIIATIIVFIQNKTNFPDFKKEIKTPPTGIYQIYTTDDQVAKFEIKNNVNGQHHLIKFFDINTNSTVLTIFLNKYESCDILVPLGKYKIKTASGFKWYGDEYLFGKNTKYQEFDKIHEFYIKDNGIQGWIIELDEKVTGNLKQNSINKKNF